MARSLVGESVAQGDAGQNGIPNPQGLSRLTLPRGKLYRLREGCSIERWQRFDAL
jgi:hypothetical protein